MQGVLIGFALVLVIWAVALLALLAAGRRTAARELAVLIPNLLALFRGLLRDPRIPAGAKALLGIGIVWIVSPVDLIPEFIPVVGPLDDAIVAALILRIVLRRAGSDVVREHWRGDPGTLDVILRVAGVGPLG